MKQQDQKQMSEKDFFKVVLDLGIAIANVAGAYRKLNPEQNATFGAACGLVVGMLLNAYSDHDNSDDVLQAAATLKAYAQITQKAQTRKFMIQ